MAFCSNFIVQQKLLAAVIAPSVESMNGYLYSHAEKYTSHDL